MLFAMLFAKKKTLHLNCLEYKSDISNYGHELGGRSYPLSLFSILMNTPLVFERRFLCRIIRTLQQKYRENINDTLFCCYNSFQTKKCFQITSSVEKWPKRRSSEDLIDQWTTLIMI